MQLIRQIRRLAKLELLLVFSKIQWLLTVGVVALIPALYLLIYLSSMWDTTSHTRALRIGLVNQDKGYTYRDQFVEMGTELVHQLMRKNDFGYYPLASPELAREQVRRGELAFALIIPADFSESAIPARSADEGRMEIYVSAGNNFQIYLIAQKYAEELDAELNQALNQQRWKFVLSSEVISKDFFELKSALSKIQKSTHDLSLGLHTASLHASRSDAARRSFPRPVQTDSRPNPHHCNKGCHRSRGFQPCVYGRRSPRRHLASSLLQRGPFRKR